MGDAYPELRENESFVLQVATSEEDRFAATLRQGLQLFEKAVEQNAERMVLPGDEAFKLSDTFGFPLQLTEELAAEAGLEVDVERSGAPGGATRRGPAARRSACRSAWSPARCPRPSSSGYQHLDADGRIVAMLDADNRELQVAEEGEDVRVFLNVTPFYAEGGGQVGDHGTIRTATGVIRVVDAQWAGPNAIMHVGLVESGEVRTEQEATAQVDRRPAGGDRARPHLHARRPLDAEAPAGRARPPGRLARRAGAPALRLPASDRPSRSRSWRRRSWRRTGGWRSTMPCGSTRPRSTRPRRRARSRCSERNTATWCAWSKSGTTRGSCAAGRTSTGRATSR